MGFLRKSKKNADRPSKKQGFGFGIGKRKKEEITTKTTTPTATPLTATPSTPGKQRKDAQPVTPPTQPIKEKSGPREEDIDEELQEIEEMPVRKLLEDLNVLDTSMEGTELVLGDRLPNAAGPYYAPYNPDNLPPRGEEKRQVVVKSPWDAKETDPIFEDFDYDDDDDVDDGIQVGCDGPEDVTRKLLQVFEGQCALLPEPIQKLVPVGCQPIFLGKQQQPPPIERQRSYYNEQFAQNFLDVSSIGKYVYM
jgi:hypothetical protein